MQHPGHGVARPRPLTDLLQALLVDIDDNHRLTGRFCAPPTEHGIAQPVVHGFQQDRLSLTKGGKKQNGCQGYQAADLEGGRGKERFDMIEKNQDSLAGVLISPFEKINQYNLIKHWINAVWALSFTSNQATYEQMKNSGSLRYIKGISLINSLQDYYNNILPNIRHYLAIQNELTENRVVPFLEDHINYQEADFLKSVMNTNTPEIFNWNKGTAIKLYNMMALLREQNKNLNQDYKGAVDKAILVMQLLKKEYRIKK